MCRSQWLPSFQSRRQSSLWVNGAKRTQRGACVFDIDEELNGVLSAKLTKLSHVVGRGCEKIAVLCIWPMGPIAQKFGRVSTIQSKSSFLTKKWNADKGGSASARRNRPHRDIPRRNRHGKHSKKVLLHQSDPVPSKFFDYLEANFTLRTCKNPTQKRV